MRRDDVKLCRTRCGTLSSMNVINAPASRPRRPRPPLTESTLDLNTKHIKPLQCTSTTTTTYMLMAVCQVNSVMGSRTACTRSRPVVCVAKVKASGLCGQGQGQWSPWQGQGQWSPWSRPRPVVSVVKSTVQGHGQTSSRLTRPQCCVFEPSLRSMTLLNDLIPGLTRRLLPPLVLKVNVRNVAQVSMG